MHEGVLLDARGHTCVAAATVYCPACTHVYKLEYGSRGFVCDGYDVWRGNRARKGSHGTDGSMIGRYGRLRTGYVHSSDKRVCPPSVCYGRSPFTMCWLYALGVFWCFW
jgi:hypothetical protein